MSAWDRFHLIEHLPVNGNFQDFLSVQQLALNDRFVGDTGHPSKSLKYFPLNGKNTPKTHRSLVASEGQECSNSCRYQ